MAKKRARKAAARLRRVHRPSRTRAKADAPVLLVVLAANNTALEEAVPVLIDLGLATTVLHAKPLSSVLREEIPVFAGLASLLPQAPESRMLLSVTTAGTAAKALKLLSSSGGLFIATLAVQGWAGEK